MTRPTLTQRLQGLDYCISKAKAALPKRGGFGHSQERLLIEYAAACREALEWLEENGDDLKAFIAAKVPE